MKKRHINPAPFLLIAAVLVTLDLSTSLYALSSGGTEGNPLMQSTSVFVVIHVSLLLLLLLLSSRFQQFDLYSLLPLLMLISLYAIVVANNFQKW
jgi:hypothetical protein